MERFVGERGEGEGAHRTEWVEDESWDGGVVRRARARAQEVEGKEGGGEQGRVTPSATLRVQRVAITADLKSRRFECSVRLSGGMTLNMDDVSGGRRL